MALPMASISLSTAMHRQRLSRNVGENFPVSLKKYSISSMAVIMSCRCFLVRLSINKLSCGFNIVLEIRISDCLLFYEVNIMAKQILQ